MNRATIAMICILLLCAIVAQGTGGQCLCPKTSTNFINPRTIKTLRYIPKGSHCHKWEIIVTKKSGQKVCVSPDAKWVKIIIKSRKDFRPHN
ncbi:interleukin-8-like [Rhincodon typus]|uniref:interleukin-8-like n=1 Tax=Rhincodon typus TaxID=259920 RepID=UPI0020306694|nr:interleukin-8-like [Rhincodon typus]